MAANSYIVRIWLLCARLKRAHTGKLDGGAAVLRVGVVLYCLGLTDHTHA